MSKWKVENMKTTESIMQNKEKHSYAYLSEVTFCYIDFQSF